MTTNLNRYKNDLDKLISKGHKLGLAMELDYSSEGKKKRLKEETKKLLKEQLGNKADEIGEILDNLPSFRKEYQTWYSEAQVLIKQLLPDRLQDFVRHYEKPKGRKEITPENYTIEDCLQGLNITRRGYPKEEVVGPDAAMPHFRQQLAILMSAEKRFESSLFNIRELVQADLFDSELDAAKELAKKKFTRGAGALAGVVLERHLSQVCKNHNIRIRKKTPGISDLNNALKEKEVIEIPDWRFIQHLADIRNLCDHNKDKEPSVEQVDDLISGVMKVIKTIF